MEQNDKLAVTFRPPEERVAITVRPSKRHNKELAKAKTFAKFGVETIRIRTKALSELGELVHELGIKQVGHGKILLASNHAEAAIDKVDELVEKELKSDKLLCHERVIALLELKEKFNKQLMASGAAHIAATKQTMMVAPVTGTNIAFPAGTPLMVAVGNQPPANEATKEIASTPERQTIAP